MNSLIVNRIARGFSANVYGQSVNICAQLFGVPILLYCWGPQLYGEWLILSAIPVYLSLSDFGLTHSAGNDMTQLVARGDFDGALIVFQSTAILTATCSLIILALVIIFLKASSISALLPVQILSAQETSWIIGLLAGEVILTTNQGTLNAGFRSCGGYALHIMIDNSVRLLQFLFLWIIAAAGGGPVGGAAAFLIVRLIATPFVALILIHKHSWITLGISHMRFSEIWRLFRPAVANLALPLGNSLNIQGIRLVIGGISGPISVVVFTTLRTLTRLILQAGMTIGHASEPEMAAAYGRCKPALLRKLYIHTSRLTLLLAIGLTVILSLASEWILRVWTHGKVTMDAGLFGWLLASTVTCTFWYNSLLVLKAANRHVRAAVFFLIMAVLAVALSYVILSATGRLSDVGIVLLLVDIVVSAYIVPGAVQLSGASIHNKRD